MTPFSARRASRDAVSPSAETLPLVGSRPNRPLIRTGYAARQPPRAIDLTQPPPTDESVTSRNDLAESESLPPVFSEEAAADAAEQQVPSVPQSDDPFSQRAEGQPMLRGLLAADEDGVVNIPFRDSDTIVSRRDLELRMNNGLITLIANQASLSDILAILAQDHGLNIVSSDTIAAKVTVTLRDVPLADALNAILSIQGLSWSRRNNIISVTRISLDEAGGAIVQGRVIRVYPLSYVTGAAIETVITELLSPVGQVKSLQSESSDSRKSADQLIVEDLPEYLDRIDSCIRQLDRPPRQVLIEAQILEVELSADNRHGVNLEALSDIAGTKVSFNSAGFAKSSSSPAMLFGIDSSEVDSLLDALKNTVDARTLASPHVLVTHGQEAKIQIGGKIGYRQSTTTETSTIQGVEFLDVGVVLTVTPYIGENGQILLKVNPEVSDGAISLETELPDKQVTTVNSTVLLNDGQGMVIGGLIREDDDDRRIKSPILGEIWMLGKLFQNVRQKRSRSEVIVVLIPRIVDCPCPIDPEQEIQLQRTESPLYHGALVREYRPWEAELPEVLYRPGQTRKYFEEFRRTEGARLTSEAPRSGDFYLNQPSPAVPVTFEAVPIQTDSGAPQLHDRDGSIPSSPPAHAKRVVPASSVQPAFPRSPQREAAGNNRQNLPDRENQTFHKSRHKSESNMPVKPEMAQRTTATTGSAIKGLPRSSVKSQRSSSPHGSSHSQPSGR